MTTHLIDDVGAGELESKAYLPDPARRQFLFGGAMLAGVASSYALLPRVRSPLVAQGALDAAIPTQVGPWSFRSEGNLVMPPQDELSQRIYDEVVSRVYYGPVGPPVMMLIAYGGGQTGMFQVHRPEACYPAQGYLLSAPTVVDVPVSPTRTIKGTFYTASGERTEQLLYWTRIGDSFPVDGNSEHIAVIRNNLHGRLPDGLLVRISVVWPDAAASLTLLRQFAAAFSRSFGPVGRKVMLGPSA